MRHAVLLTYSASATKVNILGSFFGLSIFTIARKLSVEKVYHSKEIAHIHVAIEYPEIMKALIKKKKDHIFEL